MSEVAERDFSTFELGDNVYGLAEGVIPTTAILAGVELEDQPASEALGELVGVLGKDKVLRQNVEIPIHPAVMAGVVEAMGTQKALSRSLWTSEKEVSGSETAVVMTGGVAPWIARTEDLLEDRASRQQVPYKLFAIGGNRVMESGSDQRNNNVQEFFEQYNRYPTEAEYMQEYTIPRFGQLGFSVELENYDTGKGDEIAEAFVRAHPELFTEGSSIVFARVANAGLQLVCQFRKAARGQIAGYDADRESPQAYVLTDTLPVAHTREQISVPDKFQSPYTGARQGVLTAKLIHEAANG